MSPGVAQLVVHPDLSQMDQRALEHVSGFRVEGRHGSIAWTEPVDLYTDRAWERLHELIQIEQNEVSVYPNGSPPVGTGLNHPARIELHGVVALDRNGRPTSDENVARKYERMLKQSVTNSTGGRHLDWNKDTGVWVFLVTHFSKIGADMSLFDLDSDSDDDVVLPPVDSPMEQEPEPAASPSESMRQSALDAEPPPPAMRSNLLMGDGGQPDEQDEGELRSLSRRRLTKQMVFPDTRPDWNVLNNPSNQALTPQQKLAFLQDALVTEQLRQPEVEVLRDQELQEFCAQYYGRPASFNREANIAALRMARAESEALAPMRHTQDTDVAQQSTKKRRDAFLDTPAARNADTGMYSSVLAINNVQDAAPHVSWSQLHEDGSELEKAGLKDRAIEARHFQRCKAGVTQKRKDGDNLTVDHQGLAEDPRKGRIESGLFMARSFRVGWGPNGELVHPGMRINTSESESGSLTYSVKMQKIGVSQALLANGAEDQESSAVIEEALRTRCHKMLLVHHELREQSMEPDQEQPQHHEPYPLPSLRLQLDASRLPEICGKFYDICNEPAPVPKHALGRASFLRHEASLWSLINILWGVPQLIRTTRSLHLLGDNAKPALERLRRNALDEWLKRSSEAYLACDECWDRPDAEAGLSKVLAALCSNDLQTACDEAIAVQDTKLALLISQIQVSSQSDAQRLLKLQLLRWKETQMFPEHFSAAHQRLYRLLSGEVSEACAGISAEQCASVHQWRLRFGLHYWHEPTSHIHQAMDRYTSMMEAGQQLVPWPRPPHSMDYHLYTQKTKLDALNSNVSRRAGYHSDCPQPCPMANQPEPAAVVHDTAFDLLELYRHDSGLHGERQLRDSLEPRGSSPLPLDVHTGWFISEVLRMQGVLQGDSKSFYDQEHTQRAHPCAQLTASFAYELLLLGLWEWAIYVFLHLRADQAVVYRAVTEILYRNLEVDDANTDPDRGVPLLLRFGLPQEMLDLCRAVRARYEADVQGHPAPREWCLQQSVKYHIACRKLKQAEATLCAELCPTQLIREPPYYLRIQFDLRPAQLVIQQTLVASGLLPSTASLVNECEEDPSVLCFQVVVEVWESETWASCVGELVQPRQQTSRDHVKHKQAAEESARQLRDEGRHEEAAELEAMAFELGAALQEADGHQRATTRSHLALSLQNIDGRMMWRLDVTSLECQKSIVDAMGMDSERREQFQSHMQIHESMWKPCPEVFQQKVGLLRLDQLDAVVSVEQNFVLEHLEQIQELNMQLNMNSSSEQKGDMFLRYMKLIRRQTYKEQGVASDASDLQRLAQVSKWTQREKVDKTETEESQCSQWRPAAMFEDGDERPQEPLPAHQQELRASLDHVSKNMISRCSPNAESELQNLHLLKNISTLEVDRLRMLQQACDDVLAC